MLAEAAGDGPGQRAADGFGNNIWVPGIGHGVRRGLDDGAEVLDGNALLEEVLQDLFQQRVGDGVGNSLLHQLGCGLFQVLHQPDGLLPVQKLVHVLFDGLGEVGQHDGQGVDDGIAVDLRHLPALRQDPAGGDAVCRLDGLDAVDLAAGRGRLQRQIVVHQNFAPGDLLAPDLHHVLVRAQRGGVVQPHGRDHKAHVLRELAAEDDDAADETAAPRLVHQRDQAVAELHFDGFHVQQRIDIVDVLVIVGLAGGLFGLLLLLRGLRRLSGSRRLLRLHLRKAAPAQHCQRHAHDQKRQMGRFRHGRQEQKHDARHHDGPGLRLELPEHVVVQAALRHAAGDDHAGGRGDHQGGELGDQAVADGGDGINLHHAGKVAAALHHADDQAGHEVDERDDKAHHRVTLDDLGGAVHCAVKVRLPLDLFPAHPGLLLVDKAGGKVRVDGHLLAGHGVQREAGGHLGHALGALGDDDELHQHDDEEDDDADNDVAPGNELAECLDD